MILSLKNCLCVSRHILWIFFATLAYSQTNEEVFREYQFNFNLPGARANGMGGAFIGLADDATSSFTNPAGLAFLTETAVTLDWRNQHKKGQQGNISGYFNTSFDVDPQDIDSAAFFSVNFNMKGWYFALFQHQYMNERQSRRFQSRSLSDGIQQIEVRDVNLDLEGTALGLGIARRFGSYKVGLTLNHLTFDAATNYQRTTFTFNIPLETVAYQSNIDSRDREWGYTLGVLGEIGTGFSWGAVLRANPVFDLQEAVLEEIDGQPILVDDDVSVPFVVPDVFGVGLRYKPRQDLSLLLDYQRVFYSQIIKDGFVIVESVTENDKDNYAMEDTDEIHVGAEWLIPGQNSVWVVRSGYYHNPLHTVTYEGNDLATTDRFAQVGLQNENHVTVGGGWVYRNRFEIDVSANFWENGREVTASFIWRKK